MQYTTFRDWLFSVNIKPLRSIQVIAFISYLFLFIAEWYSMMRIPSVCLLIHLP